MLLKCARQEPTKEREIYSKGLFVSPMRSVTVFSYIFFPKMERYYLNKKMSLFKASVISKLQSVILAPCLLELTLFGCCCNNLSQLIHCKWEASFAPKHRLVLPCIAAFIPSSKNFVEYLFLTLFLFSPMAQGSSLICRSMFYCTVTLILKHEHKHFILLCSL